MQLQDQLSTLEQSKRLKELGIIQDTLWQWKVNKIQSHIVPTPVAFWIEKYVPSVDNVFYSAFTVAELSIMLLEYAETCFSKKRTWRIEGADLDFTTQAEASADRLISLIENNILDINEVNERLIK